MKQKYALIFTKLWLLLLGRLSKFSIIEIRRHLKFRKQTKYFYSFNFCYLKESLFGVPIRHTPNVLFIHTHILVNIFLKVLLFPHFYFHCSLNLRIWPIVLPLFYFSFNRSASAAYKEDVRGETLLGELRRQYHCAAYNCLVSIISCTQTVLKFYTGLLFAENPAKVEHDFWYENKTKSDLICLMSQSKTLNKKMKFFIEDFFSKCDQICRKLRIWPHLFKKSLIGNFIFCCSEKK